METRDYENDCESIFREDVIEKKITGRGAFGKTSCTRKRNGGMPSDFLRGRKLKEYMGNSEVKTYNIKDLLNPVKTRKARIKITPDVEESICNAYLAGESNKSISETFSVAVPTIYNIVKRNGIQKKSESENFNWNFTNPSPVEPEAKPTYEEVTEKESDYKEPEHLAEEIAINYQWEYEHLKKKCELLKEENEKYRIALLNLATRLI